MQLPQNSVLEVDVPTKVVKVTYPHKVGDAAGVEMNIHFGPDVHTVKWFSNVKDESDLRLYQEHLPSSPETSPRTRRVLLGFGGHFNKSAVNLVSLRTDIIQVKMHVPEDEGSGLFISV